MVADNNPKGEPKKDERPSAGPPPPHRKQEPEKRTSGERAQALADSPEITAIAEGDPLDPFWSEKTEAIENVDQSKVDLPEAGFMAIQPTTPTTWSDSQLPDDWLKWEEDSRYSRDVVRLKSSGAAQTLLSGTVLGKVTATGLWVALDPAGTGGVEVAAGILVMTTVVPIGQDIDAAAVVRDALVVRSLLIFGVGTPTQPQKDAAFVALEAKGIIARQGA